MGGGLDDIASHHVVEFGLCIHVAEGLDRNYHSTNPYMYAYAQIYMFVYIYTYHSPNHNSSICVSIPIHPPTQPPTHPPTHNAFTCVTLPTQLPTQPLTNLPTRHPPVPVLRIASCAENRTWLCGLHFRGS